MLYLYFDLPKTGTGTTAHNFIGCSCTYIIPQVLSGEGQQLFFLVLIFREALRGSGYEGEPWLHTHEHHHRLLIE
jgi:hypothetical protein